MKHDSKLENYQAKQELLAARPARAKRDNKLFVAVAAGFVALAVVGQLAYFGFGPGQADDEVVAEETTAATETPQAAETDPLVPVPDVSIAENRSWTGSMDLNGQSVGIELAGDLAPQAVANFVSLARDGYFEGINCHRLVTAGIYVLQCGDPSGNGTGGPGYNWGPIENAPEADLYQEGVLAMARRGGDGESMGSQFFIVYQDSTIPSDQAGGYTVFGKVTSGLDVVKDIAAIGTVDGSSDASPLEEVLITAVSVE
jgi:peptidyl-prolyl cis-trans isomerase B (cyclophilin B)